MKAKKPLFLATGMMLLFFLNMAHLEAQLKDPSSITVDQKNLAAYIDVLKKVYVDLGNPGNDPDELENHKIQVEYFVEAEGYRMSLFRHADLSKLDLSKVDLRFLDLGEANFSGTCLDKADLKWTDLKECDFTGASLVGTNCTAANLKEANFTNADLSKAVFDGADMHEATGLTIEQLLACKSLSNAKLPGNLMAEVQKRNPKLLK